MYQNVFDSVSLFLSTVCGFFLNQRIHHGKESDRRLIILPTKKMFCKNSCFILDKWSRTTLSSISLLLTSSAFITLCDVTKQPLFSGVAKTNSAMNMQ